MLFLASCTVFCSVAAAALAQDPSTQTSPPAVSASSALPPGSLAYVAPAHCGLFVELFHLAETDQQLRRANFGSLAHVLGGGNDRRSLPLLDWRRMVRRHLGIPPDAALATLFGQGISIAAPNWQSLDQAVFLLRLSNPSDLDAVVNAQRVVASRKRGGLHWYRTRTGLWVASNGRFAAFSRMGDDGSLFADVVDILGGERKPVLTSSSRFVESVAALRGGYVGYVYLDLEQQETAPLPIFTSDMDRAAVGLHVRRDRLDFQLHAMRKHFDPATQKQDDAAQHAVDVQRVGKLPESTLAALAMSADFRSILNAGMQPGAPAQISPFLPLLRAFVLVGDEPAASLDAIGPRFVIVCDRLRGQSGGPQFGLLIEAADAEASARAMADQLADLANRLLADVAEPNPKPSVRIAEHLDTPVRSVPLAAFRASAIRSDVAELLAQIEPAFAPLGGWVAVATNPAYMAQLIDAHRGWIPTLATLDPARFADGNAWNDASVLVISQPAMAAAFVADWTGANNDANPQAFGNVQRPMPGVRRHSLGIGIRRTDAPGVVEVARVDEDGPAADVLQTGDQIVGIDGTLLGLSNPIADLRRRLAGAPTPQTASTLRVLRDGKLTDVSVRYRALPPAENATAAVDPIDAWKRLQAMLRKINDCVLLVRWDQDPRVLDADLSLALQPIGPTP